MPHVHDAGAESRVDVALLLRGISDEYWKSTLKHQASNLMLGFPQNGSVGFNADIIREAILDDMDADLLTQIIGRELVSRLRRGLAERAGLSLDLKFCGIEVLPVRPMRVLRMTASRGDVASIYSWLVGRIRSDRLEKPPAAETFGPWDWGGSLDSIVRLTFPSEGKGISGYSRIFQEMSNDGFIEKAMFMSLRRLDRYYQGSSPGEGLRH
jgi:hypothetical protein